MTAVSCVSVGLGPMLCGLHTLFCCLPPNRGGEQGRTSFWLSLRVQWLAGGTAFGRGCVGIFTPQVPSDRSSQCVRPDVIDRMESEDPLAFLSLTLESTGGEELNLCWRAE